MTVITLYSISEKIEIMKNKKMLKGNKPNVFITNDLTKKERKNQLEIENWAKEERKLGKKVFVGYQNLKINDIWFTWENIKKNLLK